MREVTGFYYMRAWRYRSRIHAIVVIAPELNWAKDAVRKWLVQNGYTMPDIVNFNSTRNIRSGDIVIVADFYKGDM